MHRTLRHIASAAACIFAFLTASHAQEGMFKKDAFTQSYADPNDTTARDTSDTMFSFKEFFGGVAHRRDVRIGTLFAGSMIFIGAEQIHNRDYWKLPIVYGGLGAGLGGGFYFRNQYRQTEDEKYKHWSTWCFVGAGLVYWGSLMDGTVNYHRDIHPHPGRATLYSILLPGLGQVYNGELWKAPIYWGGLALAWHFLETNHTNYVRFKRIHNEITGEDPPDDIPSVLTEQNALYYRNIYRRYRDYSIVALAAVYLLQIIDANVFAYMHDFELDDKISMQIEPTVLTPDTQYAAGPMQHMHFGLRIGVKF